MKIHLLMGIVSVAAVAGIAGAILYTQMVSADVVPTNTGKYADPTTLTVTEVGSNKDTDKIAAKLEDMGAKRTKTDKVDAQSVSDLFILSETVVKSKAQDKEFHDFLKSVLEKKSKIITTGGDTSALIEDLKEAGIVPNEIRNSMEEDPMIVGFALADNGTPIYYSSNLPEDAGQIQYLLEWIVQ